MDAGHMQGSRIRLISKSEIRYEGTLSTIDPQANTVSLKNVRMHGTEGRPADRQIQASDARYDFIIFRGSDIKDLTVYEDDKRKQDFIDPAVVTAQPARGGKGGNQNRQQGGGFNAHNNNNNTHNNNNAHNNQHHGRKGGNFQHQDKPARGMFDQFNNFDNRRQEPPRHENFGHGQVGGYGGHSGGKDHRGGKGGRVDFQGRGGKGAKGGNFHHNNHHNNHQHHGGNNQHNRHHDNNRRREPHVNPFATHTGTNFKAKDEEEAAEKRKNAGVEEEFNFTDKTMDMTKVKEEAEKEDIKADNGYDKKKSFFDTLSCETTDRGGAKPAEGADAPPVGEKKAQREKLRKYDIDTFGADAVTAIERSFHRERGHGKGGNHRNNHHAGRGMGGRGNMRRAFGGPAARGGRGQGVARGRRW